MNIQRLTSLGSVALMIAAIGCGGSGGNPGTGGTSGTGGTTGTGGSGVQSSEFSFSLAPTALMLPLGGMQTVTVTIDRDKVCKKSGLHGSPVGEVENPRIAGRR